MGLSIFIIGFIIFVSFNNLSTVLVKIAQSVKLIYLRLLRKIIDLIFVRSFSLWILNTMVPIFLFKYYYQCMKYQIINKTLEWSYHFLK